MMGSEADVNIFGLSFEEFCRIPLRYLEVFGLDYIFDGKLWKEKRKFFGYFYFMFIVFGVSGSAMAYSVYLITRNEIDNTNVGINLMLLIVAGWKLLIILFNQSKLRKILRKLKKILPVTKIDQNRFKIQNIHSQQSKLIKIYGNLSFSLLGLIFIIFAFNFIQNGPEKIPLLIWLPIDYSTNSKYFLACLWILILDANFVMSRFIVDWIFYIISSLMCIECEILAMNIKEIMNQDGIEFNDLKSLIIQHQNLNQLVEQIAEFFSSILLFYFIEALQLLSLVGFYVAVSVTIQDSIIFSICLIVLLGQTFMPFHFCQKIADANDRIIDAFYEGKWEEITDKKASKLIIFVLLSSHKSRKFTAKNFVVISHESFRMVSNFG